MKFHENPSGWSGRTDEQRDMTKLIVACRNSAKEIEKENHKYFIISIVNRKRNSNYIGLPVILPKSFLSYSNEVTRSLTSDNACTMRCHCINFAILPEASSFTLHTQLSPT